MSWETILKSRADEYRKFTIIDRDIAVLIREIKQGKSSPQFQDSILKPIYNIMSGMKSASLGRNPFKDFWDYKKELEKYLTEKIAPLNRNLAQKVANIRYITN